jgi:hypothetical protein
MLSLQHESQLTEVLGPVPPLSRRMKDALPLYNTIAENTLSSLVSLSDGLKKLESKLEEENAELKKAAYTHSCHVQNLRGLLYEVILAEQLALLFSFRTFFLRFPLDLWELAHEHLGARSRGVLPRYSGGYSSQIS